MTSRLPGVSFAAPGTSLVLEKVLSLDVGGVLVAPGWFIPRAGGVRPSLSLARPSVAKRSVENECGDRFAAIAASRRSLAAMAAAGESVACGSPMVAKGNSLAIAYGL